MKSLVCSSKCAFYMAILAVVLFAFSPPASAQGAGYDLFQTGSGASVDLSGMNLGVVDLQGVPIQSATGTADTIMYRPQAVPSGGGTIPVNLFALFMKSQSSVNYKGTSADVYITVNNSGGAISTSVLPQPDTLSASNGTITVHPSTSTFDSKISINADVIVVTAGGNPSNSAAVLTHQAAPTITLSQTGSSYSTTPPSGYPESDSVSSGSGPQAPASSSSSSSVTYSSGGFYPKPVHPNAHPVTPAQTCTPSNQITPGTASKSANSGQATALARFCVYFTPATLN
jgi:hypothetical protein